MQESKLKQIQERRLEKEKKRVEIFEDVVKYRTIVNAIFSSPEGEYFLNKLKRACLINVTDEVINPTKLIEDAGKRKIWDTLIRQHVDKTILAKTEQ